MLAGPPARLPVRTRVFLMRKKFRNAGFSLVELLVGVVILAVLAGVSGAAYQKAMGKASLAAEVNAGKNLTQAYFLAASENGGRYLAAYDQTARNQTVLNAQGRPVSMPEVKYRYPFRLAPYFNYQMEGTILVNRNEAQIIRQMGSGGMMYDYGLSVFPAMGINRYLVGGSFDANGGLEHSGECIRTPGQADKSVIVFASAGSSEVDGYEYVTPPNGPRGQWSSAPWTKDSDPGNYGHVAARFDGKAVAGFLDGSVRVLSLDELRDMRLWSRNAALANDPNYRPQ
ncbi:MAG: type II secretion system protein [Verrucomicrobia bacterium]|nr:type II secretion system protein [Verrucomicrobiota bacterium]